MIVSPSDRADRAAKARDALQRSFLDRAGGDRVEAERLRREHYAEMGRRSGSRRRAKAAARRAQLDREAETLGAVTESELLALAQGKR